MGSGNSKQQAAERRMTGAALEEQRRLALEQHGILIPPAFGVTGVPSQKGVGPSLSVQHRLMNHASSSVHSKQNQCWQSQPVSYFAYLQETDLSTCMLKDHMVPGLWVAAQAAAGTTVRVNVSGAREDDSSTKAASESTTSTPSETKSFSWPSTPTAVDAIGTTQLMVEKAVSTETLQAVLQLRAETEPNSSPLLSGAFQATPHTSLFASVAGNGHGWCGGHVDRTFRLPSSSDDNNTSQDRDFLLSTSSSSYEALDTMCRQDVNAKVGAWLPLSWTDATCGFTPRQAAHGYAAINLLGATAAVHASLPVDFVLDRSSSSSSVETPGTFGRTMHTSTLMPTLQTYFSINLNDTDRPPLQITLERSNHANHEASISLSQVLAFDRRQWNPLEDRAPRVRNTVGWTVRMASVDATSTSSTSAVADDDAGFNHVPPLRLHRVALGAAWQINRGVALKAVVHPQDECVTAAVILKRWKHPRLACSLLGSYSKDTGCRFLGVGVELETGELATHTDAYYYNHHPSAPTVLQDCDNVPRTIAALPKELPTHTMSSSGKSV